MSATLARHGAVPSATVTTLRLDRRYPRRSNHRQGPCSGLAPIGSWPRLVSFQCLLVEATSGACAPAKPHWLKRMQGVGGGSVPRKDPPPPSAELRQGPQSSVRGIAASVFVHSNDDWRNRRVGDRDLASDPHLHFSQSQRTRDRVGPLGRCERDHFPGSTSKEVRKLGLPTDGCRSRTGSSSPTASAIGHFY